MRKFGLLVVEGPHDVEFCHRLFGEAGLVRAKLVQQVDGFFGRLIPKDFPPKGDLLARVPVPHFFQNEHHAIAIRSAIGDSALVKALRDDLAVLKESENLSGVGLMLDSDSHAVSVRYKKIRDQAKAEAQIDLPEQAGTVSRTAPRTGAFVLPDNAASGTLEDLLLEGAQLQFPELLTCAQGYVHDALGISNLPASHLKDIRTPAGKKKATIGAMASIFRPGKSVQVSIEDNDWIRGDSLNIPRIKAVQEFLYELFEMKTVAA